MIKKLFAISFLFGMFAWGLSAQNYPQVVVYETSDEVSATFTTVGADAKSKNVQDNAVKSLFYTLFYVGVDGVNNGQPLITKDNKAYVSTFFSSRIPFFVKEVKEMVKPAKNRVRWWPLAASNTLWHQKSNTLININNSSNIKSDK